MSNLLDEIKDGVADGIKQAADSAPDSTPTNPGNQGKWWRRWTPSAIANIIATLTALIVACTALMRPETSARKVYGEGVVAQTHLSATDVALQEQIDALQAEHAAPSAVLITPDADAGLDAGRVTPTVKNTPIVATLTPLKPRSFSPKKPTGYHPPSYEAVTGTTDIGPTITH